MFGHSRQLWGLAINPRDGSVATAGYDKQIVCWAHNRLLWRIQVRGRTVASSGAYRSEGAQPPPLAHTGQRAHSRLLLRNSGQREQGRLLLRIQVRGSKVASSGAYRSEGARSPPLAHSGQREQGRLLWRIQVRGSKVASSGAFRSEGARSPPLAHTGQGKQITTDLGQKDKIIIFKGEDF